MTSGYIPEGASRIDAPGSRALLSARSANRGQIVRSRADGSSIVGNRDRDRSAGTCAVMCSPSA